MSPKTIPIELYVANDKHHKSEDFLKDKAAAQEAMQLGTFRFVIPPILRGDRVATNKWNQLIKLYKDFSFVSSADTDILTHYCLAHSELDDLLATKKELVVEMEEAGKTKFYIMQNLNKENILYNIKEKRKELVQLGGKLFLDPVSRIKAVTQPKPKKADPVGDAGFPGV